MIKAYISWSQKKSLFIYFRRKQEEGGGPLLSEGLAEESDSENVFHE